MCATLLESFGALDKLAGYVSEHGRRFYNEPAEPGRVVKLRRTRPDDKPVPASYVHASCLGKDDGDPTKLQVSPF